MNLVKISRNKNVRPANTMGDRSILARGKIRCRGVINGSTIYITERTIGLVMGGLTKVKINHKTDNKNINQTTFDII